MKTITTASKLFNFYSDHYIDSDGGFEDDFVNEEDFIKAVIEFANMHVKAALETAAAEAQVEICDWDDPGFSSNRTPTPIYGVDSDSILNAYPLSNIK